MLKFLAWFFGTVVKNEAKAEIYRKQLAEKQKLIERERKQLEFEKAVRQYNQDIEDYYTKKENALNIQAEKQAELDIENEKKRRKNKEDLEAMRVELNEYPE